MLDDQRGHAALELIRFIDEDAGGDCGLPDRHRVGIIGDAAYQTSGTSASEGGQVFLPPYHIFAVALREQDHGGDRASDQLRDALLADPEPEQLLEQLQALLIVLQPLTRVPTPAPILDREEFGSEIFEAWENPGR